MAATGSQKIGYEGYLYSHSDPNADENTTTGWNLQGYVTGFSPDEPDSDIPMWNKTEYEGSKPGRIEKTGTVDQIYTKREGSFDELYEAHKNFGVKLEIRDSTLDIISETKYYTRFYLTSRSFNPGNLNDGEDKMTTSYGFRFNDVKTVPYDETDGTGGDETDGNGGGGD